MSEKSQLIKLVKRITGAAIFLVTVFVVLSVLEIKPELTNSVSFDSKMIEIHSRNITTTDIMSIGSSMSLNNLYSEAIIDSFKELSYYNFSAWGLQMSDVKNVATFFIPSLRPKMVLICSSIQDFRTPGNNSITDYFQTSEFSRNNWKQTFYLENYSSIADLIYRKVESAFFKRTTQGYNSLHFDSSGGVTLHVPPEMIDSLRWNAHSPFPTKYTEAQYRSLEVLGDLLKKSKIPFAFIQAPIKKSYYESSDQKQSVVEHTAKCRSIVENRGGLYLDYSFSENFLNDSLFVDQFHLSAAGADKFTKKLIPELKERFGVLTL